ncbi:unnamed protein product [Pylaiella littoralis]
MVGVEKSKATRVCHDCGGAYSGKKTKWYEMGPEDGSGKDGGAARPPRGWRCSSCYQQRRGSGNEKTKCQSPPFNMPDIVVPESRAEIAEVRVRLRVEEAVGRGEIVFSDDVAEWLVQDRSQDRRRDCASEYIRRLTKKIFNAVANTPGSKSRVVDLGRGLSEGGDARRKPLFLFADEIRDEV